MAPEEFAEETRTVTRRWQETRPSEGLMVRMCDWGVISVGPRFDGVPVVFLCYEFDDGSAAEKVLDFDATTEAGRKAERWFDAAERAWDMAASTEDDFPTGMIAAEQADALIEKYEGLKRHGHD